MSRFRWPVQFGLLNTDALWIFDEVQLFGNGLATSLQLQGFREAFGTVAPARSVWMSATIHSSWFETVDAPDLPEPFRLSEQDREFPSLHKKLTATKHITRIAFDPKTEAEFVLQKHKPGHLTLWVVNTVRRAQETYNSLKKAIKKQKTDTPPELLLLHSHFRPTERQELTKRLKKTPDECGLIAVCTQVVEAGMDISAATLITDLAPWPSLVQRFGRCNRYGEFSEADIFWVDLPENKSAPYSPDELNEAREILSGLSNAQPSDLPQIHTLPPYRTVIRKRDLLELFDTTPDLAGADIDVSRFIREADDHSVQVFWREFDKNGPTPEETLPHHSELCPCSSC